MRTRAVVGGFRELEEGLSAHDRDLPGPPSPPFHHKPPVCSGSAPNSPRDVIIQSAIRLREEVLLPQRMRLARVVIAAHVQLAAAHDTTAAISIRRDAGGGRTARTGGSGSGIGVRVLRGGSGEGAAAEELRAVGGVLGVLAGLLQGVELGAQVGELGAEVADALVGLLLLGRVQLLPRQRRVLVEGPREGRQRRRDGAQRGGGRRRIGRG